MYVFLIAWFADDAQHNSETFIANINNLGDPNSQNFNGDINLIIAD